MESIINYQEFITTRETFHLRQQVPLKQIMQMNMSIEKFEDIQFRNMIYQVKQEFLELETTDVIEVPSSWWQAFKEQVYPKWMQKIFIVKYSEIDIKRVRVCPHIEGEPNQSHFRFLSTDREALRVVPTSLS